MKLIKLECPSCGGKVSFDFDKSDICTCNFCGSDYLVTGIDRNTLKLKDKAVEEKVEEPDTYEVSYRTTFNSEIAMGIIQLVFGIILATLPILLKEFVPATTPSGTLGEATDKLKSLITPIVTCVGCIMMIMGVFRTARGSIWQHF